MLNPEGQKLVRHLIYPTPDPRFPFLGVHFTRMIRSGVGEIRTPCWRLPAKAIAKRTSPLRDMADVFTFPGFWRFLARYPSMATYELKRSLSTKEFCRSLQRLVPEVQEYHLSPGGSGVRAQALAPDGTPRQDFGLSSIAALHLIVLLTAEPPPRWPSPTICSAGRRTAQAPPAGPYATG